jgi:hypothetical protein
MGELYGIINHLPTALSIYTLKFQLFSSKIVTTVSTVTGTALHSCASCAQFVAAISSDWLVVLVVLVGYW